jgi:hypothetical protein
MQDAWVETAQMLNIFAGAAIGALATLLVTWWINRNQASRSARRETYLELLSMLKATLRVQEAASLDYEAPMPGIIHDDRIDEFNARLEIDASPRVRELASQAFTLSRRFNLSVVLKVPVEVGELGLYRHRFDLVRGGDRDTIELLMRTSLGRIHDELQGVVNLLSARVRQEVHGTLLSRSSVRRQAGGEHG